MSSRTRTRTRRRNSSGTALVAVAAVVLVAAAVIAVVTGGGDGTEPSGFDLDAVAAPTITGAPLASGATGVPAPVVRGEALLSEGEQVLPVEGQATMIVFLAHWCPHCNAEVPVVVDWLASDPLPDDVEVMTVATAIDPAQPYFPPDTWLRERGWVTPTLTDPDGSVANAYGVDSYPYWVFVDGDGIVQGVGGAQTAENLTQIADQLSDL